MPLVPTFLQVDRGEMLWTDLHFNPRVIVIRKGVFSCLVHVDRGRDEVPLALYGAGIAIGMAELFVPDAPQKRDVAMSSMYYLRSVFAGEICVFPAGIIRKALEIELPERARAIISCALTNQFAAACTLAKIVSYPSPRDRIISLLMLLKDMSGRGEKSDDTLRITHEEIARLVAFDRVSTTRALHKLRDEGAIELGYKSIKVLARTDHDEALADAVEVKFYTTAESRAGGGR